MCLAVVVLMLYYIEQNWTNIIDFRKLNIRLIIKFYDTSDYMILKCLITTAHFRRMWNVALFRYPCSDLNTHLWCLHTDNIMSASEYFNEWEVLRFRNPWIKWVKLFFLPNFVITRLHSRRVVMCLVVVQVRSFICSFVRSLIESRVFNIFWPNLKYRKKKVPRKF